MLCPSGHFRSVALVCVTSLLCVAPKSFGRAAKHSNAHGVNDRSRAIVIGFVGGFVRSDNPTFGTVRLANRLRREYPSGVVVRVFRNHHEARARREVLRLLDTDGDGSLSAAEKEDARIIIYGHSWGGAATVQLARQLQRQGIPVLLTVQVDSVSKLGENDAVIPSNVEEAANFYQPGGIIRGISRIRAANPGATEIVGNFRFDYGHDPVSCEQYPWHDRILMKTHMEIDCDPRVWNQVESLIRSKLPGETQGNDLLLAPGRDR
jgi:pimeloyl-ACP methyl ester carboxylesterase